MMKMQSLKTVERDHHGCKGCVYSDTESSTPSSICSVCSRNEDVNSDDCYIAIDEWLNDYRLIGKHSPENEMRYSATHVLRIQYATQDDEQHVYYLKMDRRKNVEEVKQAYRSAGRYCD